ncbi:hypothetical protein Hanom_Chr12g01166361 [Helianthus anomalus]
MLKNLTQPHPTGWSLGWINSLHHSPKSLKNHVNLDFYPRRTLRRQRHVCNFVTCDTMMTLTCGDQV